MLPFPCEIPGSHIEAGARALSLTDWEEFELASILSFNLLVEPDLNRPDRITYATTVSAECRPAPGTSIKFYASQPLAYPGNRIRNVSLFAGRLRI